MMRQASLRSFAKRVGRKQIEAGSKLIIAPHPDDEIFGTGGLIAKDGSAAINVAYLTSGGASHDGCCSYSRAKLSKRREAMAKKAAAVVGLRESNLFFLRHPDGKLPRAGRTGFRAACDQLVELLDELRPAQVFAPHPFEVWSDHLAAEELARAAIRKSGLDISFYHYCVWFWIYTPLRSILDVNWTEGALIDIKDVLQLKRQARRKYLRDIAPCGYPTCGRLSDDFLRAVDWEHELYFSVPLLES
jgi:LmbE family N-acetylglucosaminyl deacetylase